MVGKPKSVLVAQQVLKSYKKLMLLGKTEEDGDSCLYIASCFSFKIIVSSLDKNDYCHGK